MTLHRFKVSKEEYFKHLKLSSLVQDFYFLEGELEPAPTNKTSEEILPQIGGDCQEQNHKECVWAKCACKCHSPKSGGECYCKGDCEKRTAGVMGCNCPCHSVTESAYDKVMKAQAGLDAAFRKGLAEFDKNLLEFYSGWSVTEEELSVCTDYKCCGHLRCLKVLNFPPVTAKEGENEYHECTYGCMHRADFKDCLCKCHARPTSTQKIEELNIWRFRRYDDVPLGLAEIFDNIEHKLNEVIRRLNTHTQ